MKIEKSILSIITLREVRKMRRCILVMSILVAAVMCFAVTAQAQTDKTVSVTASAKILGATSLSKDVSAFAYGDPTATPNPIPPSGDVFPTTPTSKRIVLTYTSNYNPWKIDVYTNNAQILDKTLTPADADSTKYGMYAKGGLVSGSAPGPFNVVPLKWVAKDPSSTAPDASAINWTATVSPNFVKDMRDQDDPGTTGTGKDESWTAGFANGYPNIAWGPVAGGGGVCVDPMNTTAGVNQYRGDPISGSVAVYVAGLFASGGVSPVVPAAAGDYSGTIYFDLYHP